MELYQLHYFMYVAKYQNMTKAAQELRVGQPAISKAIKALESEFQVQLLMRNGKRISLTHEGKLLQIRLLPIIQALDTLPAELQLFGEKREVIKINVLSCNMVITHIIKMFKQIERGVVFVITDQRERTDWDLCIRSTDTEISYKNGVKFLDEKILLASKRGTWLDDRERVSLCELKEELFIMLQWDTQIRIMAEAKFHDAGIVPNVVFECDTPYIAQQMTEEGMGVSLWPEFTWGKNDQVKFTDIKEEMRRSLYLLRQTEHRHSQAAQRFADFFLENIDKVL